MLQRAAAAAVCERAFLYIAIIHSNPETPTTKTNNTSINLTATPVTDATTTTDDSTIQRIRRLSVQKWQHKLKYCKSFPPGSVFTPEEEAYNSPQHILDPLLDILDCFAPSNITNSNHLDVNSNSPESFQTAYETSSQYAGIHGTINDNAEEDSNTGFKSAKHSLSLPAFHQYKKPTLVSNNARISQKDPLFCKTCKLQNLLYVPSKQPCQLHHGNLTKKPTNAAKSLGTLAESEFESSVEPWIDIPLNAFLDLLNISRKQHGHLQYHDEEDDEKEETESHNTTEQPTLTADLLGRSATSISDDLFKNKLSTVPRITPRSAKSELSGRTAMTDVSAKSQDQTTTRSAPTSMIDTRSQDQNTTTSVHRTTQQNITTDKDPTLEKLSVTKSDTVVEKSRSKPRIRARSAFHEPKSSSLENELTKPSKHITAAKIEKIDKIMKKASKSSMKLTSINRRTTKKRSMRYESLERVTPDTLRVQLNPAPQLAGTHAIGVQVSTLSGRNNNVAVAQIVVLLLSSILNIVLILSIATALVSITK